MTGNSESRAPGHCVVATQRLYTLYGGLVLVHEVGRGTLARIDLRQYFNCSTNFNASATNSRPRATSRLIRKMGAITWCRLKFRDGAH